MAVTPAPDVPPQRAAGPQPGTLAFALRTSASLIFVAAAAVSAALLAVSGWMLWVYLALTVAVVVVAVVALTRRGARLRGLALASGWLGPPVLLIGAFFWMTGAVGDYFATRTFDAEPWRAQAGAHYPDRTRLRMVDDLRASGRLDRLTHAEVRTLLGEPLPESSADAWLFVVGNAPSIGPDVRFLRIHFGPDGRVVRHELFDS